MLLTACLYWRSECEGERRVLASGAAEWVVAVLVSGRGDWPFVVSRAYRAGHSSKSTQGERAPTDHTYPLCQPVLTSPELGFLSSELGE